MLKSWTIIAVLGSLALAAPTADAQSRGNDKGADIPRAYVPPPGMCRVWLDDVPAGQQPAPTDCRTALRKKPPKAQVIFGDDYVRGEKRRESTLKGFKEGDARVPSAGRAPAPRKEPRAEPRDDPPKRENERRVERPADRGGDRGGDRPRATPPGKRPIWKP